MPLISKLTPEEVALYEVVRNPVLLAEFIRNYELIEDNLTELPKEWFSYSDYQKRMICDFNYYVVFCTARAVGKTTVLTDKIIWYLVNSFWDNYILFTAPNKNHIMPVFKKIITWLEHHPFLRELVKRRGGINRNTLTIQMQWGYRLECRVGGVSGTGRSVVGQHTEVIFLDEASFYPTVAWHELQPVLNTWQPGHQLVVAGVPDGRRDDSILYYCDQVSTMYTRHRVSAYDNPRFTKADEKRALEQYGGRDSQLFKNLVLGEHGDPTFAPFSRDNLSISTYAVYRSDITGKTVRMLPYHLESEVEAVPRLPNTADIAVLGVDLGYTDPSSMIILYRDINKGKWFFHARIILKRVEYPKQEEFIYLLDRKFDFWLLAIDVGSAGLSLVQNLKTEGRYTGRMYIDRIVPVNYSATLEIGEDEEGKPLRVRTKEFGMQLLQEMTHNGQIIYSSMDDEMIDELTRTTYTKTVSGRIIYRTRTKLGGENGEDHNVAALLTAVLGWYMKSEVLQPINRRRLYTPRFYGLKPHGRII